MATQFRNSRSFAPRLGYKPASRHTVRETLRPTVKKVIAPPPLPGCIVDAVLRFHDEVQDQGCGRSLLRLSANRLADHEVVAALGAYADRAARVSILWNEREGEIIRVLEDAAFALAA